MRIVLAIFDKRFEAFTSLKPFFQKYPEYKKHISWIHKKLIRDGEIVLDGCVLKRLNVRKAKI